MPVAEKSAGMASITILGAWPIAPSVSERENTMRIKTDRLIKAIMIMALTAITYEIAHHQSVAWRGYDAVGGELLIWILPAAIWAVRSTVADWVTEIRAIWEEGK